MENAWTCPPKIFPHIGGKTDYLQKQIYDLQVISSEYMAYFINRAAILHKNIILLIHYVSPNLLFEKVLNQIMACQGFILFLEPNTLISFIFNVNVDVQFYIIKNPYTPYMINLKLPWPLLFFSLKYSSTTHFHPTFPCMTFPSWKPLQQPRREPWPLTIPLQLTGIH